MKKKILLAKLQERRRVKQEIDFVSASPRYGIIDNEFQILNSRRIKELKTKLR